MNPYIDAILEAAAHAKDVTIDEDALVKYAKVLAQEDLPIPDWRAPVFPAADDEKIVQFLGVADAINFCFTDPYTKQKYETEYLGKNWTGAYGMDAALMRALDAGTPVLDPLYLATISAKDVKQIFEGNPPIPMLKQRLQCLRSAGQALIDHFRGSYIELFRRCGYHAFNNGNGIVEQLVKYDPCYSDMAYCESTGSTLPFHKRANLFVLEYHGRALASNGALPLIEDAADITPPADYEVPKALRHKGVFHYSRGLAYFVDSQIPILARSRLEIEIRAQMVAAMVRLCQESGHPIAAVDFRVWSDGRTSEKPHHLTSTTAY